MLTFTLCALCLIVGIALEFKFQVVAAAKAAAMIPLKKLHAVLDGVIERLL